MQKNIREAIFFLTFFSGSALCAAAELFDFRYKDGEMIRKAAIVAEDATYYVVKLHFLPERIYVEKAALAEKPRKAIVAQAKAAAASEESEAALKPSRSWRFSVISLGGILTSNTGFADAKSRLAPSISGQLGIDFGRNIFWGIGAIQLGGQYTEFRDQDRFLKMVSFTAGPEWKFRLFKNPLIMPAVSIRAGISQLQMRGYEFEATTYTFSSSLITGVVLSYSRLTVTALFSTNYIFDQELNFFTYGGQIGVGLTI